MPALRDFVLSQPGVAGVREDPGLITLKMRDGRVATVGCCWLDALCEVHRWMAPEVVARNTALFRKSVEEFVHGGNAAR